MANPNIVNVTSIYGGTAVHPLETTFNVFYGNPNGSGRVVKLNTMIVSNISTTAQTCDISYVYGGQSYKIVNGISIPANSSLTVIDKSTSIYITEGSSLGGVGSAVSALNVVYSYEEIS